jgi:hypothetical protein
MNSIFRNILSHNKLRGLLTRKKVTSLLILIDGVAVLFATPTVSFASSLFRVNASRTGDGEQNWQSSTTSASNVKTLGYPEFLTIGLDYLEFGKSGKGQGGEVGLLFDTFYGWVIGDSKLWQTTNGGRTCQQINYSIHDI